eukprot:203510-Amphidinium_carterae.1
MESRACEWTTSCAGGRPSRESQEVQRSYLFLYRFSVPACTCTLRSAFFSFSLTGPRMIFSAAFLGPSPGKPRVASYSRLLPKHPRVLCQYSCSSLIVQRTRLLSRRHLPLPGRRISRVTFCGHPDRVHPHTGGQAVSQHRLEYLVESPAAAPTFFQGPDRYLTVHRNDGPGAPELLAVNNVAKRCPDCHELFYVDVSIPAEGVFCHHLVVVLCDQILPYLIFSLLPVQAVELMGLQYCHSRRQMTRPPRPCQHHVLKFCRSLDHCAYLGGSVASEDVRVEARGEVSTYEGEEQSEALELLSHIAWQPSQLVRSGLTQLYPAESLLQHTEARALKEAMMHPIAYGLLDGVGGHLASSDD